jgi:hypothetical protein
MRWCKKEMKEAPWMDPQVREAVTQFTGLVKTILGAADAEQFSAAQAGATALVRSNAFLRWAPVPSPLPRL